MASRVSPTTKPGSRVFTPDTRPEPNGKPALRFKRKYRMGELVRYVVYSPGQRTENHVAYVRFEPGGYEWPMDPRKVFTSLPMREFTSLRPPRMERTPFPDRGSASYLGKGVHSREWDQPETWRYAQLPDPM